MLSGMEVCSVVKITEQQYLGVRQATSGRVTMASPVA